MVVAMGGDGEMWRALSKDEKFQLCGFNKSWISNAQHGDYS
jgi:hypothetical protein